MFHNPPGVTELQMARTSATRTVIKHVKVFTSAFQVDNSVKTDQVSQVLMMYDYESLCNRHAHPLGVSVC